MEIQNKGPEIESVRQAMELAWKDHHKTREQTWKTVQMVALLVAAIITLDYQYKNFMATFCGGILIILAAFTGLVIARHHRKVERRKFIHIFFCEEFLGLHRDDIIPSLFNNKMELKNKLVQNDVVEIQQDLKSKLIKDGAVGIPQEFKYLDIINPFRSYTALFIIRLHIAIIIFTLIFLIMRYYSLNKI